MKILEARNLPTRSGRAISVSNLTWEKSTPWVAFYWNINSSKKWNLNKDLPLMTQRNFSPLPLPPSTNFILCTKALVLLSQNHWPPPSKLVTSFTDDQGIAGLDCWIAQSGLQSVLLDWIVIDNPISKLDFWFGLAIQQCLINPNPKKSIVLFLIKEIRINLNFEAKPIFLDSVKKFGGCFVLTNKWSLGTSQFQKNIIVNKNT